MNSVRSRIERVENAFDPGALIRICTQNDFSQYAQRIDLPPSRGWGNRLLDNFLYYQDNGSDLLAVAHLDHVQDDGTCTVIDTKDGPLALSGALDDRLGVYTILELLPKLGIEADILLTTNEEIGSSTASYFQPDKEYNWMFEFDRGGTDVVMYQYETDELNDLVKACGARVGLGSYSDIADLEHLDCAGFNWGVGYYDYHSRRSHAWLDDTFRMVAKFMKFHKDNHQDHLQGGRSRSYVDAIDCPDCDYDLDEDGLCWNCGHGIINK